MAETDISRKIRESIRKAFPGIRFTRLQCGMAKGLRGGFIHLSENGWPDYIGYLPNGRFFAIEVKDPDGHTNKKRELEQDSRLEDINRCGGYGIKVTSPSDAVDKTQRIMESTNL